MSRRTRGFPPARPLARRSACPISMGHYQRDVVEVRDPAQHQILYDMNRAHQRLRDTGADQQVVEGLVKCYGNLMRMWLDC